MQKNLGWSRLEQGRFAEAETHLREALFISDTKASAHCLLARLFEMKSDTMNAETEWEKCLRYSDSRNSDEDAWIDMARKSLIGDN
jgi:Tfp pilus assembly protein PilF